MSKAQTPDLHGRGYWRSLEELAQSDTFRHQLENEFPGGIEPPSDGVSRRRFLQIMAASAAMAGLAGCRWPEETIVPFAKRPDGYVPGTTRHFATACEQGGVGWPLLATSYDGRPIKVDGNPDHPWSQGAATAQLQASVLDLWDVDRSRAPRRRQGNQEVTATWEDFAGFADAHLGGLAERRGQGLAFLLQATGSPTAARLTARLRERFPAARWYEHEPVSDAVRREAARVAFGRPLRDVPHLEKARVIADFDADLLGSHHASLRNARMFARGRKPVRGEMNRLYCLENGLSSTGSVADHRVPVVRSQVLAALAAVAARVVLDHGVALPARAGLRAQDLAAWRDRAPQPEVLDALAADLAAHRGASLVAVGDRQPLAAHHLAHVLNAALGNLGETVTFLETPAPAAGLPELTAALQAGRVGTLVILGGNPVATAPADVPFGEALGKANASIHLGRHRDATAARCTWHLPRTHYLESWGDAVAADGTVLAIQPLIEPLHGARSDLELLALLAGDPAPRGHDLVRTTFHRRAGGSGEAPAGNPRFEERWRGFLHDGFAGEADGAVSRPGLTGATLTLQPTPAPTAQNLELVIAADPCIHDGRYVNNAWLHEMPDFATKVAWDNVAAMSPGTAAALGVQTGDLLELEFQGRKQDMPAYILPGQASHSVTVTLGYGRQDAGRVGTGVGHDAYALRPAAALHGGPGLKIRRTGQTYELACTQDHHAIDPTGYQERERRVGALVRGAELDHYLADPEFIDHQGIHHPPLVSLWEEKPYDDGHKWGMSIDLSTCIGCNACQIACQAENNIPVVGKQEIGYSREMHWIRVDRYFTGDPEDPQIAAQPVACVHCEMAPCEQVCPVNATVHTEEGLNAMVYNRCVGTRYCANNCPYKVRRFNFFNNLDELTEPEKMRLNPDVTVRARGVMEKCTYCVQRIQTAKITASNERRPLQDGEITPACAQTCPTGAIVFGDLNDPDSQVSAARAEKRSYDMLAYLNIKPRTSYQGRIRNPHPTLATPYEAKHGYGEGHGGDHDGHGNDHGDH